MPNTEKRKLWLDRIKDYRYSRMTAVAYCEANHISVHQLRSWITKFNKEKDIPESPETEWISVGISKTNIVNPNSTITIRIGIASIELTKDFDKSIFADIVEVLSPLC